MTNHPGWLVSSKLKYQDLIDLNTDAVTAYMSMDWSDAAVKLMSRNTKGK